LIASPINLSFPLISSQTRSRRLYSREEEDDEVAWSPITNWPRSDSSSERRFRMNFYESSTTEIFTANAWGEVLFVHFIFLGQREAGDLGRAKPLPQLQSPALIERLSGLREDHLQTESRLTGHFWLRLVLIMKKWELLVQLLLHLSGRNL
jgi:hypothetical protein